MFAAGPVRTVDGDPGGICPPDGAERVGGHAFADGSVTVTYTLAGEARAAADHYKARAAADGFRLLRDTIEAGRRWLVFSKPGARLTVGLREDTQTATMVRIAVTSIAPADQAPAKR